MVDIFDGYNEKGINPLEPTMHVSFGFEVEPFLQKYEAVSGSDTIYGLSKPGTATSKTEWMIWKVYADPATSSGKSRVFADGVANFTKEWDERESYTY